ncbi:MAG TPA: hypothetical protein DE117_06735 [Fervidobacterium sp.]|nr:hypothetical protein [Fervidobacterium sp.]
MQPPKFYDFKSYFSKIRFKLLLVVNLLVARLNIKLIQRIRFLKSSIFTLTCLRINIMFGIDNYKIVPLCINF